MRTLALAATMAACSSHGLYDPEYAQSWTGRYGIPEPETRAVQVLSLDDLTAVPSKPPGSEEVVSRSLPGMERCAEVVSAVAGSFTTRRPQVMFSVRTDDCKGARGTVQIVYDGGTEVWRAYGAPARRAFDIDGDGLDEWVETSSSCAGPQCSTEAWVVTKDGDEATVVVHIEEAQLSFCDSGGGIRWTSVGVVYRGGLVEERRTEHWREC